MGEGQKGGIVEVMNQKKHLYDCFLYEFKLEQDHIYQAKRIQSYSCRKSPWLLLKYEGILQYTWWFYTPCFLQFLFPDGDLS